MRRDLVEHWQTADLAVVGNAGTETQKSIPGLVDIPARRMRGVEIALHIDPLESGGDTNFVTMVAVAEVRRAGTTAAGALAENWQWALPCAAALPDGRDNVFSAKLSGFQDHIHCFAWRHSATGNAPVIRNARVRLARNPTPERPSAESGYVTNVPNATVRTVPLARIISCGGSDAPRILGVGRATDGTPNNGVWNWYLYKQCGSHHNPRSHMTAVAGAALVANVSTGQNVQGNRFDSIVVGVSCADAAPAVVDAIEGSIGHRGYV